MNLFDETNPNTDLREKYVKPNFIAGNYYQVCEKSTKKEYAAKLFSYD
jgi:hypothetical protein